MKKVQMIVALAAASISTASWGLHATTCSDAEATLKRSEQEIWGANIVRWYLGGQEVPEEKVAFDYEGRTILSERQATVDELETTYETFAAKVAVEGSVERMVICESWKNNAID